MICKTRIITTNKLSGVVDLLSKIGLFCSNNIEETPFSKYFRLPKETDVYNVNITNVFVLASCFDVLMLLRQKKEVTLPRYHALEQSNHPCHGRLAFFHDNVITFNVFKIAYASPQQPMDFSICSICGHTCANLQQTWILPQKHPMNCHKNTKRFTAKTPNVLPQKRQMNHSENSK